MAGVIGCCMSFTFETVFKGPSRWGHVIWLQQCCCICSFTISLFLSPITYKKKISFYDQSALSASAQNVICVNCPGVLLWETNISCKGNQQLFLYKTPNRKQKGHTADRLFHRLSKATACQCLDLMLWSGHVFNSFVISEVLFEGKTSFLS